MLNTTTYKDISIDNIFNIKTLESKSIIIEYKEIYCAQDVDDFFSFVINKYPSSYSIEKTDCDIFSNEGVCFIKLVLYKDKMQSNGSKY
jgi:hypothetical protein